MPHTEPFLKLMNHFNQPFIPIQYTSVESLYVLNSPDNIGLYHEPYSHQRRPQRRNSSGHSKESEAN